VLKIASKTTPVSKPVVKKATTVKKSEAKTTPAKKIQKPESAESPSSVS
jgi:hypothetical protein